MKVYYFSWKTAARKCIITGVTIDMVIGINEMEVGIMFTEDMHLPTYIRSELNDIPEKLGP